MLQKSPVLQGQEQSDIKLIPINSLAKCPGPRTQVLREGLRAGGLGGNPSQVRYNSVFTTVT